MLPQVLDMVPRCSLKSLVEEKILLDAVSIEGWGHGQVQVSVMFCEEKRDSDTIQTKLSVKLTSLVFCLFMLYITWPEYISIPPAML